MWETWVQSLGWEDPLEKETVSPAPVFSPGELHGLCKSIGSQRVRITERLSLFFSFRGFNPFPTEMIKCNQNTLEVTKCPQILMILGYLCTLLLLFTVFLGIGKGS